MASVSPGGHGERTAAFSSHTFTALSVNSAHADRQVFAVVMWRRSGTPVTTVSSITIGGVTAALVSGAQVDNAGSNTGGTYRMEIYVAVVPTGTTADVAVTMSAQTRYMQVQLYTTTDAFEATPHDVATANDNNNADTQTTVNYTLDLDVPANGFVIGAAWTRYGVAAPNFTWTGLTEDADISTGPAQFSQFSSASISNASASTPLAVQASATSGDANNLAPGSGLAVSFAATGGGGVPEPASRRGAGGMNRMTGGMQMRRRSSGIFAPEARGIRVPERRVIVPGWQMPKRQPMRLEMR